MVVLTDVSIIENSQFRTDSANSTYSGKYQPIATTYFPTFHSVSPQRPFLPLQFLLRGVSHFSQCFPSQCFSQYFSQCFSISRLCPPSEARGSGDNRSYCVLVLIGKMFLTKEAQEEHGIPPRAPLRQDNPQYRRQRKFRRRLTLPIPRKTSF